MAGGVAEGVCPEFKPQNPKKKKKTHKNIKCGEYTETTENTTEKTVKFQCPRHMFQWAQNRIGDKCYLQYSIMLK
jgi:hypothetical protein